MNKRIDTRISPATAKAHGLDARPDARPDQMESNPTPGEDEELERKRSSAQRRFLSALGSNPSMPPPSPRQPHVSEAGAAPPAAAPAAHATLPPAPPPPPPPPAAAAAAPPAAAPAPAPPPPPAAATAAAAAAATAPLPTTTVIASAAEPPISQAAAEPVPWMVMSNAIDGSNSWMDDGERGVANPASLDGEGTLPSAPLEGFDAALPATVDISAGIDAMAIYEGAGSSSPGSKDGDSASDAETLKLARNTDVSVDWHAQLLEVQKQVSSSSIDTACPGALL
jgi:hypothetical protein